MHYRTVCDKNSIMTNKTNSPERADAKHPLGYSIRDLWSQPMSQQMAEKRSQLEEVLSEKAEDDGK